ncbi:MAG: DUF4339 domain-containing protein [Chthoniobacterales bacterium]
MRFFVAREGVEIGEFEDADFENKIRTREILPTDHFWSEGMTGWLTISKRKRKPAPPTAPPKRRPKLPTNVRPVPVMPLPPKAKAGPQTPAARLPRAGSIGCVCVLLAVAGPLLWPGLILLSFPLAIVALGLAIQSIRQRNFLAGIALLIVTAAAAPLSWMMFVDRDRMLSEDGRQQILQELRDHR